MLIYFHTFMYLFVHLSVICVFVYIVIIYYFIH